MREALIYIMGNPRPMSRYRLRFPLQFSMGYDESDRKSKNDVEHVPKRSCSPLLEHFRVWSQWSGK